MIRVVCTKTSVFDKSYTDLSAFVFIHNTHVKLFFGKFYDDTALAYFTHLPK